MAVVRVNSLDVRFPFEPYGCQREYMGKVLQCLQEVIDREQPLCTCV